MNLRGMNSDGSRRVDPLVGLAAGRIVLGAWALVSPGSLVRSFGLSGGPEHSYLTRIFGARAIALGAGYLSEPPAGRRRWHRLALFVDTSDTLTAVGHLVRRDVPTRGAAALGVLTGGYLLVGATRLIRELAAAEPAAGAESVGPAPA
jgi:hypothetical protein